MFSTLVEIATGFPGANKFKSSIKNEDKASSTILLTPIPSPIKQTKRSRDNTVRPRTLNYTPYLQRFGGDWEALGCRTSQCTRMIKYDNTIYDVDTSKHIRANLQNKPVVLCYHTYAFLIHRGRPMHRSIANSELTGLNFETCVLHAQQYPHLHHIYAGSTIRLCLFVRRL